MAEVDMGATIYDFNKNIMKQLPVIEDLAGVKETLYEYIENPSANQYLMMYCRERSDYTLFNFAHNWDREMFVEDVLECVRNRGFGIVNCEIVDDGVAIELWVKSPGQMEEAYLYYIFPADEMVIEY